MELKFSATVDLKPSDVEKIIRNEMMKAAPGMSVKSVRFEAGQEYDRMDRPCGYVFKGVKVELAPLSEHDGRGPG
jgi:hypothetical protein